MEHKNAKQSTRQLALSFKKKTYFQYLFLVFCLNFIKYTTVILGQTNYFFKIFLLDKHIYTT